VSIDSCQASCERFVRFAIPSISAVASKISTIPAFEAAKQEKRNSYRFVEGTQPNWWQVPRELWATILNSTEGRASIIELEKTLPFQDCIGKWIYLVGRGTGHSVPSGAAIAKTILSSYLFEAGAGRWKPRAFSRVWSDCVRYFDPLTRKTSYKLFAPVMGPIGLGRKLKLEDGRFLQNLPVSRVARLGSLNNELAGVTLRHRFWLWTTVFLIQENIVEKKIEPEVPMSTSQQGAATNWEAMINKEVAIFRSFLHPLVSIPTYALVLEGYPRDPVGGPIPQVHWRPAEYSFTRKVPLAKLRRYALLRSKFLAESGTHAWGAVMASMRRFALAWENPFVSDVLAGIVAALEGLLVRDKQEVSYKLRIRAAHLLTKDLQKRREILKNLSSAYDYRSRVFHGDYVFDDLREWATAKDMKRAKGKGGDPFYDLNKVNRLVGILSDYYRSSLAMIVRSGKLEMNWSDVGL